MSTETLKKPAPAINPKLIAPFVNSVRSVFQTMVKVETTVQMPRLKADPCPSYDVSGIIGFSGDVIGNVVVSLQMAAAKSLVAAFAGMPIEKARPKIAERLEDKGLLVGIEENYTHNIALNSRGKGVIEPQIMLQWFVDVNRPAMEWKGQMRSFKEVMRAVVEDGDINIIPQRFEKLYYPWIDNLRDWCVSRQIWWGHQIARLSDVPCIVIPCVTPAGDFAVEVNVKQVNQPAN